MKIISATFLDSGLQKDRCFFLTNCPPIHHLWWMGGFVFLEKYEKRRAAYLAQLSSITVQDECTQLRPRGTLIADQRRACAARPRGNIQGNGWRLRRSGHANFPCHGGRVARATPSFIQAAFTSHTGSLLLSSLKKVTFPSFLRPPISRKRLDISRQIAYHESGHNLLRGSIS